VDLHPVVTGIANRWPTVGLAVGVVRDGSLVSFAAHGLADIASGTPVTADTVFRIGSVTKTFTAVAVMQLWEQGLVDLDAPAEEYLTAYRLIPARARFRPATVRHLLTHTAGIREVLRPSGLLRMRDLGETVRRGRPVPTLAEYYGRGLRVDAEPGTRFTYTNHGFATLGQIVTDVTGELLHRYLREHVLDPLGMDHSDLVRSDRVGPYLATGYELRARGAVPVADYELVPAGAGALYSSPRDLAGYLAALLGGGANQHGRVLKPETVATMFQPHYRPDPRIPGQGLAFFRSDLGGHLGVEHDGILPGFDAQVFLAPDDGVAVVALANGARRGMHWMTPEAASLVRRLIGVPSPEIRADVPHHPEVWSDLVGRYRFSAHASDPARLAIGLGARVMVRHGQLMVRLRSPIPALHRGFVLHPDDPADPYAFRVELPWFGIGTSRLVFSQDQTGIVSALHVDVGSMSFHKQQ
jgi:CubicO group peptidase (beta-lactamase class C family)